VPWPAGSSRRESDSSVGYVKLELSLPHPVLLSPTPLVKRLMVTVWRLRLGGLLFFGYLVTSGRPVSQEHCSYILSYDRIKQTNKQTKTVTL
jgi:hypothetical protein